MIRPLEVVIFGSAALAASFMLLISDQLTLAWELGAVSTTLLVLGGLMAIAQGLPPLPALVLSEERGVARRIAHARAGDRLARLHLLETLDEAHRRLDGNAGGTLVSRRDEILNLPTPEFDKVLASALAGVEGAP